MLSALPCVSHFPASSAETGVFKVIFKWIRTSGSSSCCYLYSSSHGVLGILYIIVYFAHISLIKCLFKEICFHLFLKTKTKNPYMFLKNWFNKILYFWPFVEQCIDSRRPTWKLVLCRKRKTHIRNKVLSIAVCALWCSGRDVKVPQKSVHPSCITLSETEWEVPRS